MTAILKNDVTNKKSKKVDELIELINNYKVIGVANLYKVRSVQQQELTKKFRSEISMRVTKNIVLKRALKKCNKAKIEQLIDYIKGSNILLFTNMNPFKLTNLLDKSKIKMTAKAGDKAPNEILIPSGNTGLPPGPAISELHEAGIRTRIEGGSVWVLQDTVVAKKGGVISPKVASVLSKLGVKPLEVGLKVVVAYDDGLIITSDQLTFNLDKVKEQIEECFGKAIGLAVSIAYPTKETITILLQKASSEARNLTIASAYPTKELLPELIAIAHGSMLALVSKLSQINKDAIPPGLS